MSDALSDYYAKEDNCKTELLKIREMFGNSKTTAKHFEVIFRALAFMLFYGPEKLQTIVNATLDEAVKRETFFALHIWNKLTPEPIAV